MELESDTPPGG